MSAPAVHRGRLEKIVTIDASVSVVKVGGTIYLNWHNFQMRAVPNHSDHVDGRENFRETVLGRAAEEDSEHEVRFLIDKIASRRELFRMADFIRRELNHVRAVLVPREFAFFWR